MPDDTTADLEQPLSLGERCIAWCIGAMAQELRPSTATLKEWFAESRRNDQPLALTVSDQARPNYCAAAQCFGALAMLQPGETIPHGPRAAAKELMADAIKVGAFQGRAAITNGFRPRPGDLAIYDRSIAGRPATAWFGHVNRVTEIVDSNSFKNIGANQGANGAWAVGVERFDQPHLLGFIAYPAAPAGAADATHANSVAGLDFTQAEHGLSG
jgi:hypothetical protein